MNLLDVNDQDYTTRMEGTLFSYEGFQGSTFVASVIDYKSYIIELSGPDNLDLPPEAFRFPVRRIVAWTCAAQMISDTPELNVWAASEILVACALEIANPEQTYWREHFQNDSTEPPTLYAFLELLIWWVWEEVDDGDQSLDAYLQAAKMWAQYVMGHVGGVLKGHYPDEPDYRL